MLNFAELDKIEAKYDDLIQQLSQPNIVADMNAYKKVGRERKSIESVVMFYRQYKKLAQELDDVENIIKNEDDGEMKSLAKDECDSVKEKMQDIEAAIRGELIPKDPLDEKNTIIEIRAGTGGEEAALFAGDIFRMYMKYCENNHFKVEMLSESSTGLGGYKEIIFSVSGKTPYRFFKYESGGHRVQRIPTTETGGRIHTSAITVAVLAEAEEQDIEINESDLKIDTFRSQGAGGQHVNTTDSAVRITHLPTGTVVTCQDEKSQHKNKAKAMRVLRSRVMNQIHDQEMRERAAHRKQLVGTGDRSGRIRTYNFPQGRVTDHRINLTLYKLEQVMEGDLDEIFSALNRHDAEMAMAGKPAA